MSKNTVTTPEDKSIETALSNVRSKAGNRFVVLGFSGGNALAVIGEGDGALAEARGAGYLNEDAEKYIYLRKDLQADKAKTTKYAFIDYTPSGVKPIRKAMLSQLRAQVVALCKANGGAIHAELSADDPKELDDAVVDDKVAAAAGIKSSITDKKAEVKVKDDKPIHQSFIPASTATPANLTPNTREKSRSVSGGQTVSAKIPQQTVKWVEGDEDKFKAGQKALKESKEENPWVLVAYSAKDTLSFVGAGNGVSNLQSTLPAETTFPHYGLVRVDLTDGKSHTNRVVLLTYMNDAIPPLKKADASTKSGAIAALLGTSHAKLEVSTVAEITDSSVKAAK